MTLKQYLLLMGGATAAGYLLLAMVVLFFNPLAAGALAIAFFYLSAAVAIVGTCSVLGLIARMWFTRNTIMYRMVGDSFRQGIWFTVVILGTLALTHAHLLTAVNALLLVIIVALFELYFMSRRTLTHA